MMRTIGLALVMLLFAATASAAAPPTLDREQQRTILSEAQAAYDRGVAALSQRGAESSAHFLDSASRYQLLVDAGVRSAPLHYNLANAYLQAGDLGRAILHYRNAARIAPSDARVRENLAHARSLTIDQIPQAPARAILDRLFAWRHITPFATRLWLAAASYLAWWALLLAARARHRPSITRTAWVCAAVSVVLGSTCGYDLWRERAHREGVILVDEVVLRKGNGDSFAPAYRERLHPGVEFVLLEERPGWLSIRLPDGSEGWIKADQAATIG